MKTVLAVLNAKNIHKSLAQWCIKAYADSVGNDITVIESNINENLNLILTKIYNEKPDVLGFSCYIWNIDFINKLAPSVKKLLPNVKIILGGPEVSFEKDLSGFPFADYIITCAGEIVFSDIVSSFKNNAPLKSGIYSGCYDGYQDLPSPYTDAYFESFKRNQIDNIENQLVYYESVRGCPFSCSYCLSSTENGIFELPLDRVFAELKLLVERGAKCIKFVDRTFNANRNRAAKILEFISALDTDCTFHFEVAADLFNENLFNIIEKMPTARVQFEIGIQSTNEKTLAAINRKTDTNLALNNIKRLTEFKNCQVHVDLIAGLVYEDKTSFIKSFNDAILARPTVLQLGFLKMLKGTKIRNESENFGYEYQNYPPYEILKNDFLSFDDIAEFKIIEAYLEKFYNSQMFNFCIDYALKNLFKSPYEFFKKLSIFHGKNADFKISMKAAYTLIYEFLCKHESESKIKNLVKADSFACDGKGLLPDKISMSRSKPLERAAKAQNLVKSDNFRIEFFDDENVYKLFDYDKRNKVTNRAKITVIKP